MQRDLSDDIKQVVFSRIAQSSDYSTQLEDWDKARND
jgi:hypothetical protein